MTTTNECKYSYKLRDNRCWCFKNGSKYLGKEHICNIETCEWFKWYKDFKGIEQ